MPERKYKLTVEERLLLHLSRFGGMFNEFEAPAGITQPGIADAIDVRRSHVSHATKRLKEKGLIIERMAHIRGQPRRRKVYLLTPEGQEHVQQLRKKFEKETIKVITDEGEEKNRVDVLAREMGKSTAEIIINITEKGIYDVRKKESATVKFLEKAPSLRYFFGRSEEVKRIVEWLNDNTHRVVVIIGIAGIGKTSIARRVCQMVEDEKNVFWYRFHEWDTLRGMLDYLTEFLEKLGRTELKEYLEHTVDPVLDLNEISNRLREDLEKSNSILFFDDLHKVDSGNSNIIQWFSMMVELLSEVNGVKMVVTSRKEIDFYDRRDVSINRSVVEMTLEGLDRDSSLEIVRRRTGFPVDDRNFERIYSATMGNPLFLELINTKEDVENPRDIHKFIQREILSVISDEEKRMLSLISVYREPVPSDAFLVGGIHYEIIDSLVKRALLKEVGRDYYEMHDLLRDFFYSRLSPKQRIEYHNIAVDFYRNRNMADNLEINYHLIQAERYIEAADNIIENGDNYISRGLLNEMREAIHEIPQDRISEKKYAYLLMMEGNIHTANREWEAARDVVERAMEILDSIGDRYGVAESCEHLGVIYYSMGKRDRAIDFFEKGLNILESLDSEGALESPGLLGNAYYTLGIFYWEHGDLYNATKVQEKSLGLPSDRVNYIDTFYSLGILYSEMGEWEKAIDFFERCLEFTEDESRLSQIYSKLGWAYINTKRKDRGMEMLQKSVEIAEKSDSPWQIADAYCSFGKAKKGKKARELLKKALDIYTEIGAKDNIKEVKKLLEEAK